MFQPGLFDGKIALVTGGRSGIGYAIAHRLLELGAQVYIASRKAEPLQAAADALSAYGRVTPIPLDIRQPDQIAEAARRIQAEAGRLDILVNNAGGQFPSAAENISINGWNAVINNNLNGSWYMMQTMANTFFIPQKQGIICNIIAQIERGFPGMAHTGAARAGVDNLTKSLAIEWVRHGLRINAIAPGLIDSSGMEQYPQSLKDTMLPSVPMRRLGSVDEVAWATLFLCSPMAQYITGETLYVDGGQRLWGSMWQLE